MGVIYPRHMQLGGGSACGRRLWAGAVVIVVIAGTLACSGERIEGRGGAVLPGWTTPAPQPSGNLVEDGCDRYLVDPSVEQFISDLARSMSALGAATGADASASARALFTTVEREFGLLPTGSAVQYTSWVCQHNPSEDWMRANGVDIDQHRKALEGGRGSALYSGLAACKSLRSGATWTVGNVAATQDEIEAELRATLCQQ